VSGLIGSAGGGASIGTADAPATGGGGIKRITSTGGTVTVTNPTGPTTDLEVPQGAGGTLASIYAFGLGAPATDNLFGMPAGNLRFPGLPTWGVHYDALISFFGARGTYSAIAPPALTMYSVPEVIGGGGATGIGLIVEQNYAGTWNGNIGQLDTVWNMLSANASNDITQGANRASSQFGAFNFSPFGIGMFNPGGSNAGPSAMTSVSLYNTARGQTAEVERMNGYGTREVLAWANSNGFVGENVIHFTNQNNAPAGGDGPGTIVDLAGLGNINPRAGWQGYQLTADPTADWGVRLWGYKAGGGGFQTVADFTVDRLALRGGAEFPSLDHTTAPLSAANTGRIIWDQAAGKFYASVNGAAYALLSTVS
jgi:hypothetical protein